MNSLPKRLFHRPEKDTLLLRARYPFVGFADIPGANASGAGIYFFGCSVLERFDLLNIRLPGLFRLIVGMADFIADLTPLAANTAYLSH
jgi:hypothetical protein